MPRKKMTEKAHYKESPYDERIEELALDIEAAKNKANKREHFWRRYAIFSTIATLALVAWGMKEAGALWHETLGVARLQEEQAADALKQSGIQAQKMSQLHEDLAAKEKEFELLRNKQAETNRKGQKLAVIARDLMLTFYPPETQIPRWKYLEWFELLESKKRKETSQALVRALRVDWGWGSELTAPIATTYEQESEPEK
tara:strand:+ start:34 stop:633 length:600 start_codon:yes stop_codon:yes gene_type:complete